MPDITAWDPSIVAQIWMYIIAAFIIGIVLGFLLYKHWFKRKIDKHREDLQKYKRLEQDYEKLQNDIKNSKEYWYYMRQKETDNSDLLKEASDKLMQ